MHISKLRTYPTFMNRAIKVYEFKRGPLARGKVLAPSEFNYEVDLTFYYRESTAIQYPMEIITRHLVLMFVIYSPLIHSPMI